MNPEWLAEVRAVSLDVDGTLYPLGWRIALRAIFTPGASRAVRLLKHAREPLRASTFPAGDALRAAVDAALATAAGMTPPEAAALRARVDDTLMPRLVRGLAGTPLRAALERLRGAGFPLVAFSDHATAGKLRGLGLQDLFKAAVSAEDVGAYKPGRAGFLAVERACGVPASSILHVGDRADTDGQGALAAGMRAAVLRPATAPEGAWPVDSVHGALTALLDAQRR